MVAIDPIRVSRIARQRKHFAVNGCRIAAIWRVADRFRTRCDRCHQPRSGAHCGRGPSHRRADPTAEDHPLGLSMPRHRSAAGSTTAGDAIRTARERSRMQTPAPVDYARAHSVDEALELLERYGPESRLIAGGHSLIPMMRLRIAQPERVIDINDLTELDYIRLVGHQSGGSSYLAIGAMTRHRVHPGLGRDRRALRDLARRGARHRRPASCATAAPSAVRSARPTRPRTCPRSPRPCAPTWSCAPAADPASFRPGSSPTARTRRCSTTPRCSSRCGSRSGPGRAAPTRRWSDGPATGRSPRPAPSWCSTATRSPTSASDWPRSAPITAAPRTPRSTCAARISTADTIAEAGRLAAECSNPSADQRGPVVYKRHLADELTRRALRRAAARAGGAPREGI